MRKEHRSREMNPFVPSPFILIRDDKIQVLYAGQPVESLPLGPVYDYYSTEPYRGLDIKTMTIYERLDSLYIVVQRTHLELHFSRSEPNRGGNSMTVIDWRGSDKENESGRRIGFASGSLMPDRRIRGSAIVLSPDENQLTGCGWSLIYDKNKK